MMIEQGQTAHRSEAIDNRGRETDNQRLKNQDTRYEQCTPYVFAMTAYIEEKQLERNIGISYSKEKKTMGENSERSYTLSDGFAVLDNITPQLRNNIIDRGFEFLEKLNLATEIDMPDEHEVIQKIPKTTCLGTNEIFFGRNINVFMSCDLFR